MSCPFSEEELQLWDSVCNPMGAACRVCSDCQCEHWDGDCPIDCDGRLCDGMGRKFQDEYAGAEEKNASEIVVTEEKTKPKEILNKWEPPYKQ